MSVEHAEKKGVEVKIKKKGMKELNIKKIQDHVFKKVYKKKTKTTKNENILNLKQTIFHVVQKKKKMFTRK